MKKGHVFMLDVFIAGILLIIGLALLFFSFPPKNTTIFVTDQLSEDVVEVMFTTQISDLCIEAGGSASCDCPTYESLKVLVCNDDLINTDTNLLSMLSEHIHRATASGQDIKNFISEVFVENNVIDEKRFGFSLIYSNNQFSEPLQLYNSETFSESDSEDVS